MKKFITLAALALMTTSLSGCGEQIEAGHVGLRKSFGKISSEPLSPGFYWYSPIGGDIIEVNVQSQVREGTDQSYTKDIQTATYQYKVSFRINPTDVPQVYMNVGQDWENRLVMDLVPDTIKNVIGQWEAAELVANGAKVSPKIVEMLQGRLADKCVALGLAKDSVEVVSFAMQKPRFSPEFEHAAEGKVTAQQLADQERNRTVQIEEQAKQQVITAKASAEAMRIQSEALNANQNLTAYKAVEKWDGKLPSYMAAETPLPFLKLGK